MSEKNKALPQNTESELTPIQQIGALLLGRGLTGEMAARALKVHRDTLYRWKTLPAFQAEMHKHTSTALQWFSEDRDRELREREKRRLLLGQLKIRAFYLLSDTLERVEDTSKKAKLAMDLLKLLQKGDIALPEAPPELPEAGRTAHTLCAKERRQAEEVWIELLPDPSNCASEEVWAAEVRNRIATMESYIANFTPPTTAA